MRRLTAVPLLTLLGCGYVQVGVPGGTVDLGRPRDASIGVWVSPPPAGTLEEGPEREHQTPADDDAAKP